MDVSDALNNAPVIGVSTVTVGWFLKVLIKNYMASAERRHDETDKKIDTLADSVTKISSKLDITATVLEDLRVIEGTVKHDHDNVIKLKEQVSKLEKDLNASWEALREKSQCMAELSKKIDTMEERICEIKIGCAEKRSKS